VLKDYICACLLFNKNGRLLLIINLHMSGGQTNDFIIRKSWIMKSIGLTVKKAIDPI